MKQVNLEGELAGRYWSAVRLAQVRSARRERAHRTEYWASELFAEPAWDILLELYAFELLSRSVSQSELAERLNVPATTAARWISMLEREGLVARTTSRNNSTSVTVELTSKGLAAMENYFSHSDPCPTAVTRGG